jgi:hypothetical protein
MERLARLPPAEWLFYLEPPTGPEYAEKYGVPVPKLREMIEATIIANEKKAKEDRDEVRRREARADKVKDKEKDRARKDQEQGAAGRRTGAQGSGADREAGAGGTGADCQGGGETARQVGD